MTEGWERPAAEEKATYEDTYHKRRAAQGKHLALDREGQRDAGGL